jgi:hypothetical protein
VAGVSPCATAAPAFARALCFAYRFLAAPGFSLLFICAHVDEADRLVGDVEHALAAGDDQVGTGIRSSAPL